MTTLTEYPQRSDPQHLLQAKEALLTAWHELPPEHQATMLLVLLKTVMGSEMRDWTVSAIALTHLAHVEPLHSVIIAPPITRRKLAELDLSEADLNHLTDADLNAIAQSMEAHYAEAIFGDELAFHTENVLKQKQAQSTTSGTETGSATPQDVEKGSDGMD
jgi:hypothetical protein